LPFGGGIRRCLGAAFAVSEMRLVFAYLLSEWNYTLAPGYQAKPAVHGFLIGPARSLQVIVHKRNP
jgi:cytochrome P450